MRWNNLRPGQSAQGTLFDVEEVIERTFDTPEFRGMTFYEVLARSIINRVPDASQVPFRWTINPYRGCSHACRYCLSGETRILMADGTTKRLADVRVDDEIYGTLRVGANRRQVVTKVAAHWVTSKRAYRVTLEGGIHLVASADHRLLTTRGWRHVQRMHGLKVGDTVVGLRSNPRVLQIEDLDTEIPMYDITTGTGDYISNGVISHNCFARRTHEYLDLDAGHDFDSKVVVKVNAPELVRKELSSPRWGGDRIAMGTNVDCYQRAEGRYRLMPGILRALNDRGNPYSILTKGTLILRDLELLQAAAEVSVNVSVGFVDEQLWRAVEPGTPAPRARLDVCRKLTDAGIGCGVLMAPVLPFLSDSPAQIDKTVDAIAAAGARNVSSVVLHLRPGARQWYLEWLGREHPKLLPRYHELYSRGAYALPEYREEVTARVKAAARRHGLTA